MVEFIRNLIGNDVLSTLIVSFLPLIELKGGIIFAYGVGFGFIKSFSLAYLGSTLAFILVFFLLIPILNLLKKIKIFGDLADKLEHYFKERAAKALKNGNGAEKSAAAEKFLKQVSVFIFVAIPLPMTGVWMGTAIAVFLGLKFKESILPVALGNVISGLIISALAELCVAIWDINALNYILYGLLVLAVAATILAVFQISRKKGDKKDEN